ncbi:MAG TPA: hypothetical protein VHE35_22790 [Kofleriaceae bacterium]|nr:hypothetical protein [Kofleriaceae bacterium]
MRASTKAAIALGALGVSAAAIVVIARLGGPGRGARADDAVDVDVVPRLPGRPGPRGELDDAVIATIRARPEVAWVVPRELLEAPASGSVDLAGQELRFEVGGFTDGIPPAAVADEPAIRSAFVDADADGDADADPAAATGPACRPEDGARACPDELAHYCDARDLRCHPRVPVLLSPTMIELYDDQLASSHGLPPSSALGLVDGQPRHRIPFTIVLGDAAASPGPATPPAPGAPRPPRHLVGAVLVGISPRARKVGLTVPLADVLAWNRDFADAPSPPGTYTAASVRLRNAAGRAAFVRAMSAAGLDVVW